MGLGKGLGGCGGVLGGGVGLGRLVGWRGHFDGMAAGGDRESWKVGVVERGMKSRGGVRFGLKEVGCLSMFVLRGRQVGVQYWK